MHVGIYLSGISPETGGGYTFQADILQSILAQAGDSRHRFSNLCDTEALWRHVEELGTPPNMRNISLGKPGLVDTAWRALTFAVPFARRLWPRAGRIQRAAARHGVDLIWFVAGGAHEIPDAPYIATVWDVQHRTHPWLPEVSHGGIWESREAAIRAFLWRAAFVITGTETGKRELEMYYQIPPQRVRLLPHPTPAFALNRIVPSANLTARFGLKPNYLLYPAQFWPHKNHINLLLALEILKSRFGLTPNLVLVGSDKGNRKFVEQAAAQFGVFSQLVFTGFVTQDELIALYRQAGALVYLSMSGPENLPPLEAFALECPVVASDIPGASEQLGDCARLVSAFSPESVATALYEVLTDSQARNVLVTRGQTRARAWTSSDFVAGVLKIVDEFEPVRRCWPQSSASSS
jgi:glycosyltransferase involved in cell wall biosynthesis